MKNIFVHKKKHKYTKEEDDFLRKNYLDYSNIKLGRALQLSPEKISARLTRLGLKRFRLFVKQDLINLLEEFYTQNTPAPVLSKKYGISESTVSKYVAVLFKKKPSEYTETITLKSKV